MLWDHLGANLVVVSDLYRKVQRLINAALEI